jgi:hypothetical protein
LKECEAKGAAYSHTSHQDTYEEEKRTKRTKVGNRRTLKEKEIVMEVKLRI